RPVNLYWDGQHVPKVIAMLAHAAPPLVVAAGALALVGGLAALFWALRASTARVLASMRSPGPRRALGAGAAVLVGLYALGVAGVTTPTRYWFSLPVAATYLQQARFVAHALIEERSGGTLPPVEPAASRFENADLARLGGADVLVVFIESYGASVYDSPPTAPVARLGRDRLGTAVAAPGRQIVSAFYESPTFGGSSWLAHITLFSGVTIAEPGDYALMLTQSRPTLARRFKAEGYRAVALMPGLKSAWPEGAFYGFDRIYDERSLDYRGPEFGWWRVPDQYSLAKLHALEIAPEPRAPLLLFFPTVNTHTPFAPTPPYQPDWSRLFDDEPFDADDVAAALRKGPEWTNLQPVYADSVAYTLTFLAGYLREHPGSDSVLVVLGDHQPQAAVAGQGARWDVPVHVITRNDAIVDTLLAAGFVAGVTPRDEALGPLEDLNGLLLRAFSSPPGKH